jgi:hypothetical protein
MACSECVSKEHSQHQVYNSSYAESHLKMEISSTKTPDFIKKRQDCLEIKLNDLEGKFEIEKKKFEELKKKFEETQKILLVKKEEFMNECKTIQDIQQNSAVEKNLLQLSEFKQQLKEKGFFKSITFSLISRIFDLGNAHSFETKPIS